VLSHHHFDHDGELARFLEVSPAAPVLFRDAPLEDRWFKALLVVKREIGLDPDVVRSAPERFTPVTGDTEIASGVWLQTDIVDRHPRPKGNRHLDVGQDGGLEADPFDHELVLVVHEPDGIAVFTGCSHHGVLNMIEAAAGRSSRSPTSCSTASPGRPSRVTAPAAGQPTSSPASWATGCGRSGPGPSSRCEETGVRDRGRRRVRDRDGGWCCC